MKSTKSGLWIAWCRRLKHNYTAKQKLHTTEYFFFCSYRSTHLTFKIQCTLGSLGYQRKEKYEKKMIQESKPIEITVPNNYSHRIAWDKHICVITIERMPFSSFFEHFFVVVITIKNKYNCRKLESTKLHTTYLKRFCKNVVFEFQSIFFRFLVWFCFVLHIWIFALFFWIKWKRRNEKE